MKTAGIDITRTVWSDQYDPIKVGPSADCPGYVRMYVEKESEDFWGKLDITMPTEFAEQLAIALAACAKEQEDVQQ